MDKKTYFVDLDEMIVNLNTTERRQSLLKIKVSLEVAEQKDVAVVRELTPRVVDNFQTYLRELRLDDLRGSAGMYRLREELLTRINIAVEPAKVKAVLFKEMIVQ
jgi:flagellar FliL protein